jgi:hypothetical protein
MTLQSLAVRIIFASLLWGCSMLEQSAVLHNLYLGYLQAHSTPDFTKQKRFGLSRGL